MIVLFSLIEYTHSVSCSSFFKIPIPKFILSDNPEIIMFNYFFFHDFYLLSLVQFYITVLKIEIDTRELMPKPIKVSYERVINLGNFESARFMLECALDDKENPTPAVQKMKICIDALIKQEIEDNLKVKRNDKGARIL